MKTLIFNGSPRKNGETAYMIRTLQENLGGEYKVVDAYRAQIRPCIDCRWCFDHAGCAVKDEWQEILSYIEECDHIIIASPVYFEEVTGMLLAVMSRLQTYFSARRTGSEEKNRSCSSGSRKYRTKRESREHSRNAASPDEL